jgi:hypothetical protein
MKRDEIDRRYQSLSAEMQIRVLASFGHNLTIAARDSYEFQAPGVRAPQRLRDINEIQHRVFAHISALHTADVARYSDDALLAILLEHEDDHLQAQSLWALSDALERLGI